MGLAALLAVLSSVSFGVSDVLSGVALRRHSTAALALWAQLTGLALVGVAVAAVRPEAAQGSLTWGVAAGALGAAAVLTFYTALQRGSTTVVAPIAGCGVAIPVLAGLVSGEALGVRAVVGVVAAFAGVLLVAPGGDDPDEMAPASGSGLQAGPKPQSNRLVEPLRGQPVPAFDGCVPARNSRSQRSSIRLAVLSAVGLGAFFVILDQATAAAGDAAGSFGTALVVALAVQVGALAVTSLAATRHTRTCLMLSRALLGTALLVGMLDLAADLLLNLAIGDGPLAVVGPLGSMAPVVSVLIATVVLRQRVRRGQGVGIAVVLIGIALIATD